MFVRQKEAKYSQISIYQFFGRQHENRHAIACSKIPRKEAVFCKSYKNTLIRVFLHAECISALKTEPKPTLFEKYAENRKKNIYHYFLFFVIFSISFKQNFLKPNESCFLDRKKPNIAKLVYINFLAVSMKIAMLQPVRKFSEKRLFSVNPIKIPLLGYFCMQNSFLPFKWSQSLRFLRNMQKIEKKNLLSLFSIFCDFLYQSQAKFPKTK